MVMTSPLDLTNCDKEKIHLIASIQGHGAFLSLSRVDLKIRNVSENLSGFFKHPEESSFFLGKRLNDLIPLELTSKIHERLRSSDLLQEGLSVYLDNGEVLEVHLYPLAEDLAGVEFERHVPPEGNDVAIAINGYLERMQKARGLGEVSEIACKAVRFLSGFERVMIYRFFPPAMYGEVIAEDKIASAQSFLHHRFPSTDIPKPARDLYLRNKVRYIHDSAGVNFPIHPMVFDKKSPLDMSDSRLRSVSRIHIEYLKNMGVRGSMSVAIIVGGDLWGIISCHHHEPQYVSQLSRRLCLQIANTLAMVAPLLENYDRSEKENNFNMRLHSFFNEIKLDQDPLGALFRKVSHINSLFSGEGVAYVTPEKVTTAGLTPLKNDIKEIWEILRKEMTGDLFFTDRLSTLNEKFSDLKEQASGILAMKVSPLDDSMLIFTRPEYLYKIFWGGDPRKNLDERKYNGDINPRASFETWTEVVKGASLPWNEFELQGAKNFRTLVFDSLVRKEELIGELHQRLKAKG